MFFKSGELNQIQQQAGAEELAPAAAMLAAAGVPCTSAVVVGRKAETIAKRARELGRDRITGPGGRRWIARFSAAWQVRVRQLVDGTTGCQAARVP